MRILFYISTISYGGAGRVMSCLANQFAAAGEEVGFVTVRRDDREYRLDDSITRYTLTDGENSGNKIKKNLKFITNTRKICKEFKPDVAVSFLPEPNFRFLLGTVGMNFKKIVSVRCDPPREYPTKLLQIAAKNLYKWADGVVFQTPDARDWFGKKVRNNSEIIFNQVDERFFAAKFDGQRKGIVTAGRIDPIKNHAMLVDAFSKIADKTDENLYIYGEGRLRQPLEEQIERLGLTDRVFMPGNTDDIIGTVGSARLFVLSSDYEGLPNALLEALAMGVPSISTDCPCGGPRMVMKDGENGLLAPIKDADVFAEKMLWALEHPEEMEKMGQCAVERAQAFQPDRVYKMWYDYISKVISK